MDILSNEHNKSKTMVLEKGSMCLPKVSYSDRKMDLHRVRVCNRRKVCHGGKVWRCRLGSLCSAWNGRLLTGT